MILLLIILVFFVFLFFFLDKEGFLKMRISKRTERWKESCKSNGMAFKIQPAFVLAIIAQESDGKETATGKKGERGLMQLLPSTAKEISIKKYNYENCAWVGEEVAWTFNLFNGRENILLGVKYLAWIRDHWMGQEGICSFHIDYWHLATHYNGGMEHADNEEVKKYATRVMEFYDLIIKEKILPEIIK